MPSIVANDGGVTHINVFTVSREKQPLLIDSLVETVQAASAIPGWISASIHRSDDGTKVVNYIQFANREAAQAVLSHLARLGLLQRNTALGTVVSGQYEVVYTLDHT